MDANKGTAADCLARAKQYLAAGDLVKAKKFATKSVELFPTDNATSLLTRIAASAQSAGPAAPGAGAAQPRQRAARAASAEPEAPRRQPTAAQTLEVTRILRLGDNKLYEKLNVEKDADGAIIKRAYKKLSLKLHPDRNPHPKAEAAFQALNKANEMLSDARQRQVYDMTGEVNQPAGGGGGGGGFGRGGGMQQVDPDELIRMMFGGGFRGPGRGGGGFHFHTTGFGGQQQQRRQQQRQRQPEGEEGQGGNDSSGLIWMIIILLSVNFLFTGEGTTSQAVYNLERTGEYTHPMRMDSRDLDGHKIKFFVKTSVGRQLATARGKSYQARQMQDYLTRIEREVEPNYWTYHRERCQRTAARGDASTSCEVIEQLDEALFVKKTGSGSARRKRPTA